MSRRSHVAGRSGWAGHSRELLRFEEREARVSLWPRVSRRRSSLRQAIAFVLQGPDGNVRGGACRRRPEVGPAHLSVRWRLQTHRRVLVSGV